MNTIPNPRDDGSIDPSSPDRLEAYAGLLGDISRLINEIEASQGSNRADHTFSFEHLAEYRAEVPAVVRELLPDLDQIRVTLTKDSESEDMDPDEITPATVSISVEFISPTKTIFVSRVAEESDQPDTLLDTTHKNKAEILGPHPIDASKKEMNTETPEDFQTRATEIERISKAEFNKLIMSLVYPDQERGYAMFADADLFSPRAYESLRDSFYFASLDNQNSKGYPFETSDTRFAFFKVDGQPTSFTIIYPEENSGRIITGKNDMETDFRLKFSTVELAQSDPFTPGKKLPIEVPYYLTPAEIFYLRSIIETEIMAIAPKPIGFEDEASSELDPEVIFGGTSEAKLILSKRYVKGVLDQLSLDSPDPGTT